MIGDDAPVTLRSVGVTGSGAYAVTHAPCGELLGTIAIRGDGSGRSWWRVAIPPRSWRSQHCPIRETKPHALRVLLVAHTCPTPTTEETP